MSSTSSNVSFVQRMVRDFPQVHLTIGLVGNSLFFVGSVFFLYDTLKTPAVWLFIFGSFGMLVGSIGKALVELDRHHRRKEGENDPLSNSN